MAQANILRAVDSPEGAVARARREHVAGKLTDKVPALVSLRLAVVEARPSGWHGGGRVRHVDLARALALFEFPCTYAHCQGGGYDLTGDLLGGLRLQRAHFEGRHACMGQCGSVACTRLMHFEVRATYRPRPGLTAEGDALEPAPPSIVPRIASPWFR